MLRISKNASVKSFRSWGVMDPIQSRSTSSDRRPMADRSSRWMKRLRSVHQDSASCCIMDRAVLAMTV